MRRRQQRLACLLPVDALLVDHVRHAGQRECGTVFEWNAQAWPWPDATTHVAVFAATPGFAGQRPHRGSGELIPVRLLSPLEIS